MEAEYYTLGVWTVKQGREAEFIDAWKAVGAAFSQLPNPPGQGILVRSESDPALFYSFGPWKRPEERGPWSVLSSMAMTSGVMVQPALV